MSDAISMKSSTKSGRSFKDRFHFGFRRKSQDVGSSVLTVPEDAPPMPPMPVSPASPERHSTQGNGFKTQAERLKEARANRGHIDTQTGELLDNTLVLHSLAHDSFDNDTEVMHKYNWDPNRPPGGPQIASLSPQLWNRITDDLSLVDCACLAFASKILLNKLGPSHWQSINHPDNAQKRLSFLGRLEDCLPNHLLCFVCGKYHLRTQKGAEKLKPTSVLNPLFKCPHATNNLMPQPRTRIAAGRTLPFTFVQLALRGKKYGPEYGIEATTMARMWREQDEPRWSHNTRYSVFKDHLLMRVQSTCFTKPGLTPAGERMLLYRREDYLPFFSVCAHWRDGLLMNICKCAITHIPVPPKKDAQEIIAKQIGRRPTPNAIIILCSQCRPMRRCPECPTEYLVEAKLAEDKSEPDPLRRFKHAIVVTRWSDLGDGSSPECPEWSAINGLSEGYDSWTEIGNRAVSGTFESKTADTGPGQRMLNLNPSDKHEGEAGNDWY